MGFSFPGRANGFTSNSNNNNEKDDESGDNCNSSKESDPREKPVLVFRGDKVYDVTNFVAKHPGGQAVLEQHNGQDIDLLMQSPDWHIHSKTAFQLLDRYYVGTIDSLKNQTLSQLSPLRDQEYYKNDIVDWNKPILQQIPGLKDKYFDWAHEPVDCSLRLFESDFLEFFSKAPWYVVPILWLPLMAAVLFSSHQNLSHATETWPAQYFISVECGVFSIPILFSIGVLFWTLLEYIIHRWLFHLRPPSNWPSLILLHFILHGQHHKSPMDSMRLVFPPVPASAFAVAFYLLCMGIFPKGMAQAVFAGIIFGYFMYDMTHYYVHHGKPLLSYFQRLKTYHALHHYEHQELGFGISSKLWDYPFGTLIPEQRKKQS